MPRVEQSIFEKNAFLLDAIHEIFSLNTLGDWDEVRRTLSDGQVRSLYEVQAALWPPDTDYQQILPQPDSTLRALYLGDLHPQHVSQNLLRFTLYADELMLVDPFHNPNCIAEEYNPLVHPAQYKFDTLKVLLFVLTLEPWIRAGMVRLVPDPGDFDYKLRTEMWALARARMTPDKTDFDSDEFRDMEENGKAELGRYYATLPDLELAQAIMRVTPDVDDEQVQEAIAAFRRSRATDPLALDQTLDPRESGQIQNMRMGANLEMADFICRTTGAFPYTSSQNMWHQIQDAALDQESQQWSELTQSFRLLDFRFLNNVDPAFALDLREAGRLKSLRVFLRDLWSALGESQSDDARQREFSDRLAASHAEATAEWIDIDRELAGWLSKSIVPAITAGAATVAGHLNPLLIAGGWALAGVTRLVQSRLQRTSYRARTPLSVFVDLSRR